LEREKGDDPGTVSEDNFLLWANHHCLGGSPVGRAGERTDALTCAKRGRCGFAGPGVPERAEGAGVYGARPESRREDLEVQKREKKGRRTRGSGKNRLKNAPDQRGASGKHQ